jgi:hypothetical protein
VEIADRLDWILQMLEWEGRTDVPVWSVLQAFGNQRCGVAYRVSSSTVLTPIWILIHSWRNANDLAFGVVSLLIVNS